MSYVKYNKGSRGRGPVNFVSSIDELAADVFNVYYLSKGLLESNIEIYDIMEYMVLAPQTELVIVDRLECSPQRFDEYHSMVTKLSTVVGVAVLSYSDSNTKQFEEALVMSDYSKGIFLSLGKKSKNKKQHLLLEVRIRVLTELNLLKVVHLGEASLLSDSDLLSTIEKVPYIIYSN